MKVTVYGMEKGCAGCETLKGVLNVNNVEYSFIDIMNPDNMAEAQKMGIRSVPVTVVNKDDVEHIFTGASKPVVDSIKLHLGV